MSTPTLDFLGFPKMARLSRECIITEKIDGTNAQVLIAPRTDFSDDQLSSPFAPFFSVSSSAGDFIMVAGSRTRWISAKEDNYGFAKWVSEHREELLQLGAGRHFGEWWGNGIQRGYGLTKGEKRFSLFNVARWCLAGETPSQIVASDPRTEKYQDVLPACCHLVPVLRRGIFTTDMCESALHELHERGSLAAPGFRKPEGIVCFHVAGNFGFKKTLEKDDVPKTSV